MKVKKIISLFLSAVMAVTAAATLAVSASAEGVKELTSGTTYSVSYSKNWEEQNYKIVANKAGKLKITLSSQVEILQLTVTNTSNRTIKPSSTKDTLGTYEWNSFGAFEILKWNSTEKKYTGTHTYEIGEGTYYIALKARAVGNGKLKFATTFPSEEKESKTTFTSFVLPMKVGDALTLGTDLSDTSKTITWASSKSSVASVTKKGKITAKAAGTATITATVGNTTLKIKVKVSK